MPRGVANVLTENPVRATCWCGKSFDKKTENQIHCSRYHRNLASNLRKYMPKIPPASPPQRKKERPTPTV
jgi:hypothetical protein